MINFIALIQLIRSEIINQCSLPDTNDFIISKYFRDKCGPCDRISNFIEEIDSRLQRNGKELTVRYVDCSKCDCKKDNVTKVPTITVHKDGIELEKLIGYRDFGEIVEFISKNTGIDRVIFKKRIDTTPGKVVSLKERDFLSGFDGPWLILFYNTKSDIKRELIEQAAEEYEDNLNVGEINGNLVPGLIKRFSLTTLPALLGLYNGVLAGYNGKDEIEPLREFIDELTSPSFPELSFEDFNKIDKDLKRGTPIFIVFYKNLGTANEYFGNIAHDYKFRAKIYKSNDDKLIEKAGANLEKSDLILMVYRNKAFLESHYEITNQDKIFQWLFQAHYPYVTRVDNDNFYAVFHGIKPVVLLLTKGEELLSEFEEVSESVHKGMPFADKLFSAIDVGKYSLFIPTLLPNISIPSIVVLDPTESVFYGGKNNLKPDNIKKLTEKMIEEYDIGKLAVYSNNKNWWKKLLLVSFVVVTIFAVIRRIYRKRLKVTQYY